MEETLKTIKAGEDQTSSYNKYISRIEKKKIRITNMRLNKVIF